MASTAPAVCHPLKIKKTKNKKVRMTGVVECVCGVTINTFPIK
jgi:hypothetical protein